MIGLARQAAMQVFGAFHELSPEAEMAAAFLVEAAATYYSDGIRPQSEVTIYLTGPAAMREGMTDYHRAHFTPRTAEQWRAEARSEEHTSELQSLMRISYAVFCLKKKRTRSHNTH